MMKVLFSLITLMLIGNLSYAQVNVYLSPGVGVAYSSADLSRLQASYTSYLSYLDANFAEDAYTADPNWNSKNILASLSFHAGIAGGGGMVGLSYFPYAINQERYVMRESGYGRKFVWKERRNEVLIDMGYGSKWIDAFVSIGANFNNYKMSSYLIYPSGTESINGEYDFNGNFRQFDAGISYGLGVKFKPINHLALELRYIIASDDLIGEDKSIGAEPALTDNSLARTPGTSQYPSDYTQPLSLTNELIPNFKRSYLQFTCLFYFNL